MNIMPSKRIVLLVIVLVLLISTVWALQPNERRNIATTEGDLEVVSDDLTWGGDPDNDGIANWQEALLGTDPFVADGDDVRKNSALSPELQASLESSITNKAAQKLFPHALVSADRRLQGESVSIEEYQAIVSSVNRSLDIPDATYAAGDITTITTPNAEEEREYVAVLLGVIAQEETKGLGDELYHLGQARVSSDAETHLEEVARVSQLYTSLAEKLLDLPVPQAFVDNHLDLVNGFVEVSSALELMVNINNDPLLAIAGMSRYYDSFEQIHNTLYELGGLATNELEK